MAFNLGNLIGDIGTRLGLPEMGISERLGGTQPAPGAMNFPLTPAGERQITGSTSFIGPVSPQYSGGQTIGTPQTTQPSGQVLGAQAPVSGGGGGGQPAPQQQDGQPPMEQAPEEPQFDFDSLIAPALQALGQAEEASRAETEANIAGIESSLESSRTGQQTELTRREGLYEQQRTREEGRVGEAVSETQAEGTGAIEEARRGASQLLQGIQSRFGGTTGTGRFTSEILGAQTTRNIANVRQQAIKTIGTLRARLQETVNQIDMEVQNTRDIAQQNIADYERQSETLKQQARAGLQSALAQIGQQRGELQSRKAEFVFQAIQSHRDVVNQVNARNTAFQQTLYQQQQAAEQKLMLAKQSAVKNMETDISRNALTLQRITASDFAPTPESAETLLTTGQLPKEGGFLSPVGTGSTYGLDPEELANQ